MEYKYYKSKKNNVACNLDCRLLFKGTKPTTMVKGIRNILEFFVVVVVCWTRHESRRTDINHKSQSKLTTQNTKKTNKTDKIQDPFYKKRTTIVIFYQKNWKTHCCFLYFLPKTIFSWWFVEGFCMQKNKKNWKILYFFWIFCLIIMIFTWFLWRYFHCFIKIIIFFLRGYDTYKLFFIFLL